MFRHDDLHLDVAGRWGLSQNILKMISKSGRSNIIILRFFSSHVDLYPKWVFELDLEIFGYHSNPSLSLSLARLHHIISSKIIISSDIYIYIYRLQPNSIFSHNCQKTKLFAHYYKFTGNKMKKKFGCQRYIRLFLVSSLRIKNCSRFNTRPIFYIFSTSINNLIGNYFHTKIH